MKEFNHDFEIIAEKLDKELNVIDNAVTTIAREQNIPEYVLISDESIRATVFEQFALENLSEITNRLYTYFKPMFDAFKKLGYAVQRDNNVVLLTSYSPAGEELNITLYLDSEDEITLQLYKLYTDFDEEDHAYMLLYAKRHGLSGVPSIKELITDAYAISEMYEQLYRTAIAAYITCKTQA